MDQAARAESGAEAKTRPDGWRAGLRTAKGRILGTALALVLAAAGVVGGIAATSEGPAVPPLYMSGIAQNPCAAGHNAADHNAAGPVVAVPVSATEATGSFLAGSSVLNTNARSSCTASAVQASRQWLSGGSIPGVSAAQRELATRALLDLRLSVQPDGAVVAGFHQGWNYTWPRDSSWVAVALADTGHSADALNILRFLQRMQSHDGTWAARYYPDGSGPVNDGRPAELDAVGWVPWAVWSWAATQRLTPGSPAIAELARLWPMVTAAANAAVDSISGNGLPRPAMDYWEDQPIEQTLGTAAPLLAGLRAAASLAATLAASGASGASGGSAGVPASNTSNTSSAARNDQARWTSAAGTLSSAIARTFGRTGYQRTPDAGSGADAAITFLGPPFANPSPAVVNAAKTAQRALTEPNGGLRPGTAWHGAPGVAWTPETAMFALFDATTGQQAAARQLLSWLAGHRTVLGELPEQVAPRGNPVSVAPLAWTDAIVLLTLLAEGHRLPTVP